ncbi:condensation domain-containing protein, partial [Paraburkholderia humisilvae]
SAYVELERLPLTPNGKLDRRALPSPATSTSAHAAFVAPRNETETTLAAIWQQVLGVERVGVRDDFFLLGGQSLLAVRMISAVRSALGNAPTLRTVFEHPVLADFAATLRGAHLADNTGSDLEAAARAPAASAPIAWATPMPLSASQTSLWFLWKMDPHSAAYHVNGALRFAGTLDVDALRDAFAALSARHPVLRMRFGETAGVPFQRIDAASRAAIQLVDLPHDYADGDFEAQLAESLAGLVRAPFALEAELPVRATLIRVADHLHVLHLVLHHIVSDDASIGLLFDDFSRLYRQFAAGVQRGDEAALAAASADAYRTLIEARIAHLTPEREAAQLAWWRAELATGDAQMPVLALPFDRTRSGARHAPGARLGVHVPAATVDALRALARARGATLFITLVAAFDALLYRYTGQRDIRIGVPLAGRDWPGAAQVAGFFVNTVVLRTAPHGEMRAAQLIDAVRERLLDAHAHQDVPFAGVVKALQVERDLTQTPLFQVLVSQQQRHDLHASFGDALRVTVQPVETGEAQFDLMLNFAETADAGLDLNFTYAVDIFDTATLARLAGNFTGLLEQWSVAPDTQLASFELPENRAEAAPRAVQTWPAPRDVVSRFVAQAAQRGKAMAIADGDAHVTYAQLDTWSLAIAHALRRQGVTPGMRVGVSMNRSAALVAALLGVLRAGAAYVPLDPSYPPQQLAHGVDDAQLGPIVVDAASLAQHAELFAGRATLDVAALREEPAAALHDDFVRPHAEQLAYVIYTSGSTGEP